MKSRRTVIDVPSISEMDPWQDDRCRDFVVMNTIQRLRAYHLAADEPMPDIEPVNAERATNLLLLPRATPDYRPCMGEEKPSRLRGSDDSEEEEEEEKEEEEHASNHDDKPEVKRASGRHSTRIECALDRARAIFFGSNSFTSSTSPRHPVSTPHISITPSSSNFSTPARFSGHVAHQGVSPGEIEGRGSTTLLSPLDEEARKESTTTGGLFATPLRGAPWDAEGQHSMSGEGEGRGPLFTQSPRASLGEHKDGLFLPPTAVTHSPEAAPRHSAHYGCSICEILVSYYQSLLTRGVVLDRFNHKDLAFAWWVVGRNMMCHALDNPGTMRREALIITIKNFYYSQLSSKRRMGRAGVEEAITEQVVELHVMEQEEKRDGNVAGAHKKSPVSPPDIPSADRGVALSPPEAAEAQPDLVTERRGSAAKAAKLVSGEKQETPTNETSQKVGAKRGRATDTTERSNLSTKSGATAPTATFRGEAEEKKRKPKEEEEAVEETRSARPQRVRTRTVLPGSAEDQTEAEKPAASRQSNTTKHQQDAKSAAVSGAVGKKRGRDEKTPTLEDSLVSPRLAPSKRRPNLPAGAPPGPQTTTTTPSVSTSVDTEPVAGIRRRTRAPSVAGTPSILASPSVSSTGKKMPAASRGVSAIPENKPLAAALGVLPKAKAPPPVSGGKSKEQSRSLATAGHGGGASSAQIPKDGAKSQSSGKSSSGTAKASVVPPHPIPVQMPRPIPLSTYEMKVQQRIQRRLAVSGGCWEGDLPPHASCRSADNTKASNTCYRFLLTSPEHREHIPSHYLSKIPPLRYVTKPELERHGGVDPVLMGSMYRHNQEELEAYIRQYIEESEGSPGLAADLISGETETDPTTTASNAGGVAADNAITKREKEEEGEGRGRGVAPLPLEDGNGVVGGVGVPTANSPSTETGVGDQDFHSLPYAQQCLLVWEAANLLEIYASRQQEMMQQAASKAPPKGRGGQKERMKKENSEEACTPTSASFQGGQTILSRIDYWCGA